jgi:hypothetical protein
MPAPAPASGPDGRPGSVRAQLVQAVACLQLALDGSLAFPLTVEVRGANGAAVSFQIQSPSELGADPLANLSPAERAIVEACPAEPTPRKRLARLAGRSCNRHFHDAINRLISDGGPLKESREGVWRP